MSSSQTSSSSSDPTAAALFAGMLDIVCPVEVLVGTGSITVRDCLKLRRASVIVLAQPAGAELEIRVQGVAVATGEIVIADDSTTIRVSELVAPPGEIHR